MKINLIKLAIGIIFFCVLVAVFITVIERTNKDYYSCNKNLCEVKYHGKYFIPECFNSVAAPCSRIQLYGNCELNNGTIISSYCNLTNG